MKRLKYMVLGTFLALALAGCGKNNLSGGSGIPIMNGQRMGDGTQTQGVEGASGFSGQSLSSADIRAQTASLGKIVYFGFDKFNLDRSAQAIAMQDVQFLIQHPDVHVLLEGHTDPRGSESYNFHLGQRRANAVQTFLLNHGVAADQICTVSYGELRPAASPAQFAGNKLKAYRLDRRVVFAYNKSCTKGQN